MDIAGNVYFAKATTPVYNLSGVLIGNFPVKTVFVGSIVLGNFMGVMYDINAKTLSEAKVLKANITNLIALQKCNTATQFGFAGSLEKYREYKFNATIENRSVMDPHYFEFEAHELRPYEITDFKAYTDANDEFVCTTEHFAYMENYSPYTMNFLCVKTIDASGAANAGAAQVTTDPYGDYYVQKDIEKYMDVGANPGIKYRLFETGRIKLFLQRIDGNYEFLLDLNALVLA